MSTDVLSSESAIKPACETKKAIPPAPPRGPWTRKPW